MGAADPQKQGVWEGQSIGVGLHSPTHLHLEAYIYFMHSGFRHFIIDIELNISICFLYLDSLGCFMSKARATSYVQLIVMFYLFNQNSAKTPNVQLLIWKALVNLDK